MSLEMGTVSFSGYPSLRNALVPDHYDPSKFYYWLRNWQVLVPFPAPVVRSLFTYRFDVYAGASIFLEGDVGTIMSFVSIGETANLLPGQNVTVDTGAGWPLIADLSKPTASYNGFYGTVSGQSTVQRSFLVGAREVPAVAIVVGVAVGLALGENIDLNFAGQPSGISLLDTPTDTARIAFNYDPRLLISPHPQGG